ncbi:MAG: hypothetical protein E7649_07170 [Ruminococcaceae bacterium]|nr:hypothetical protein [Oscillospiraceae bacterium]
MDWWIALPVAVAFMYIFTVAWLLPRFFLQNRYKIKVVRDRGIRKYKSPDDKRAIVYEPDLQTRKYIKQYVLTDDGREKVLKCKISEDISYLEYDIALFDGRHKVYKVLNVCDMIEEQGYTQPVALPAETSYVTIILSRVNNDQLHRPLRARISFVKALSFVLLSLLMSVVTAFAFKIGFANSFGGVFRQSFLGNYSGHVVTLVMSLVLCLVAVVAVSCILLVRNFRISKKVRRR